MRPWAGPLFGVACLTALVLVVFNGTLFRDELPLYRDSGHFYYPLYAKVQAEWQAGRVPLWDPGENGGMPLLGNPSAAVLYPPKVLYGWGLWSYAWGMRAYTIFHVVLAVGAMYALARTLGVGRSGAGLAALGYGFGGPILFQYCNIIFLVGAAWAPLGLRAADRWLRQGKRLGLAELAIVLAMQTLGGDPQTAYFVGVCSAGYAALLAAPPAPRRKAATWVWFGLGLLVWVALVFAAAVYFPDWLQRIPSDKPRPEPRVIAFQDPIRNVTRTIKVFSLLNGVGVVLAIVFWTALARWAWKRFAADGRKRVVVGLAGLLLAGSAGGAITGAQLLPVLEFTGLSMRAAEEAPHDAYAFSVLPHRAIELLCPEFYGSSMPVNHSWLNILPPRAPSKPWVPSLYMGGLTFLLAMVGFGFRDGPRWRAWFSAILVITALGALGEYAGPLWWARFHPGLARLFGYHDPIEAGGFRFDLKVLDGDGGPYWLLSRLLPGFQSFRFPVKLWTIGCVALAVLAGHGWDRVRAGATRQSLLVVGVFVTLTLLTLTSGWWFQGPLLAWAQQRAVRATDIFGPANLNTAFHHSLFSLIHAMCVLVGAGFLVVLARKRPRPAAVLLLLATSADLATANRRLVISLPRSVYDDPPKVIEAIARAEKDEPSDGPYRVYRMDLWHPPGWLETPALDRAQTLVRWEYDTIQPKYGLLHGVEYTITQGTTELYDIHFFFAPFERRVQDPELARMLGVPELTRVVYYPRRGFDLWNTRYFVVPRIAAGWKEVMRGFAAFLPSSTMIAPTEEQLRELGENDGGLAWAKSEDWQVFRNHAAFPRAWLVHDVRVWAPVRGLKREDREDKIASLLYPGDAFWSDSRFQTLDLRKIAFVETRDLDWFDRNLDRQPPGPDESVRVVEHTPQRVVLEATLERPGLVVLADVAYPGWRLTIDDEPAEVLTTNRLMRGARVESGSHRLVYTYGPDSFATGKKVSAAGLAALAVLIVWGAFSGRRAQGSPISNHDEETHT